MRLLVWALRALVFFALFALALNNQQAATLHWFFGLEWRTTMIIALLAAFSIGCAIGVLAMVPRWWRGRPAPAPPALPPTPAPAPRSDLPSQFGAEAALPPRESL